MCSQLLSVLSSLERIPTALKMLWTGETIFNIQHPSQMFQLCLMIKCSIHLENYHTLKLTSTLQDKDIWEVPVLCALGEVERPFLSILMCVFLKGNLADFQPALCPSPSFVRSRAVVWTADCTSAFLPASHGSGSEGQLLITPKNFHLLLQCHCKKSGILGCNHSRKGPYTAPVSCLAVLSMFGNFL